MTVFHWHIMADYMTEYKGSKFEFCLIWPPLFNRAFISRLYKGYLGKQQDSYVSVFKSRGFELGRVFLPWESVLLLPAKIRHWPCVMRNYLNKNGEKKLVRFLSTNTSISADQYKHFKHFSGSLSLCLGNREIWLSINGEIDKKQAFPFVSCGDKLLHPVYLVCLVHVWSFFLFCSSLVVIVTEIVEKRGVNLSKIISARYPGQGVETIDQICRPLWF